MRLICFLFTIVFLSFGSFAQAREAINVSPDKPEIVNLNVEAASIIVGSPRFASVTLDTPETLLIIPRAVGATSLTVLNNRGEIVLERQIVVGAPKDQYVRIRRACPADLSGCVASQTYYCDNGCSDVSLDTEQRRSSNVRNQDVVPLVSAPVSQELEPLQ